MLLLRFSKVSRKNKDVVVCIWPQGSVRVWFPFLTPEDLFEPRNGSSRSALAELDIWYSVEGNFWNPRQFCHELGVQDQLLNSG